MILCTSLILFLIGSISTVFYLFVLWTDRSLEFWLSYIAGHQVILSNWVSALFALLFNVLSIFFNLFTEIIRVAL